MTSSKPTTFASYHVTLVHLAKEWLDKLWNGYMNSKFFSKIIKDLQTLKTGQSQLKSSQGDTITEVTNPPPPSDPSATQTPHENSDSATTDQANSNATADVSLQEISTSAQDGKIIATDGTFTLIGKALYFSERKQSALRLCIPEELIPEVLKLNHDALGHPGIRRTYLGIHLCYYFRKMPRSIRRYVNNCSTCQTSKPSNENSPGLLYPIPLIDPFHTISLDFITEFPESNGSNAARLSSQ